MLYLHAKTHDDIQTANTRNCGRFSTENIELQPKRFGANPHGLLRMLWTLVRWPEYIYNINWLRDVCNPLVYPLS